MTPPRETLHERTLEMLGEEAREYGIRMKSAYPDERAALAEQYAYAAQCVREVAALREQVEALTASNRKLTTMLEEEAYHRMAAESRAEPDSGNVRIEVTDSEEVTRLRAENARLAEQVRETEYLLGEAETGARETNRLMDALRADVTTLREALEYIVDADDPRWTDHCTTALATRPTTPEAPDAD